MKRRNQDMQRRDAGFTLIEILLVVVIIGILAAIAVPRLGGRVGQSQVAAARASIRAISTAIDLYETDNGKLPESLQNLITKGSEPNWNGPYLRKRKMPADPWNNPYHYAMPGQHGKFDIFSLGADNAEGGEGEDQDVKSWD